MDNKTFINLSRQECEEAYKKIIADAKRKWSAVEPLAQTGNYDLAIAAMIVSLEELSKGLILFFDSQGFRFRNLKGMAALFKNHNVRYVIVFTMFTVAMFGEELKKLLMKYATSNESLIAAAAMLKSGDKRIENVLARYALRQIIVIKREFEWFQSVDSMRQSAFYSGYEGTLKLPSDLIESDYLRVYEKLNTARESIVGLIAFYEANPQFNAFLLVEDSFKSGKIYRGIEGWLTSLPQHGFDAFKALKAQMPRQSPD